jgi:hypothetical protein
LPLHFSLLTLALLFSLLAGCDGRADVIITGKISKWSKRDTMYVSLTRNWESIRLDPKRFDVKRNGAYELEFSVGRNPPPVTFVRNNSAYAVLTLNNLRGPSPLAVDEIRNVLCDIKYENGVFRIKLDM